MRVLGIDPGSVSGAWALFDWRTKEAEVGDLPVVERNIDCGALLRLFAQLKPDEANVELVGAMPRQGVSSIFKFGVAVGEIYMALAASSIPYRLMTPAKWKRTYRLKGGAENKDASRALAKRLFPGVVGLDRKRDHGRAEALLLAAWASPKERMWEWEDGI